MITNKICNIKTEGEGMMKWTGYNPRILFKDIEDFGGREIK